MVNQRQGITTDGMSGIVTPKRCRIPVSADIHGDDAISGLVKQRAQRPIFRTQIAHPRNGQNEWATAAGVIVGNMAFTDWQKSGARFREARRSCAGRERRAADHDGSDHAMG